MADFLYVCHFSNGHIKVGRSIEPMGRIAAHVDRVACFGVELSEHFIAECVGASEPRESHLIARCAEAAKQRHKHEWFTGLDYLTVCDWAHDAARLVIAPVVTPWRPLIADLIAAGMNQTEIANRCGCGQSAVSKLLNGTVTDPQYSLGEKLIALHRATTTASLPQTSLHPGHTQPRQALHSSPVCADPAPP